MKLPKDYISFSQMALWEKSPEQYIDKYIHGKEQYITPYMTFGKELMKKIEVGHSDNFNEDLLIQTIPRYKEMEVELNGVFKHKGKDYKLFGYADSLEFGKILDYKTSVNEWTQEQAEQHGQLDFYNIISPYPILEASYIWIETKMINGQLAITGNWKELKVSTNLSKLSKMGERIAKFIDEVENYTPKKILKI